MKKVLLIVFGLFPLLSWAKTWVCAVEYTDTDPTWVFVNDDIAKDNDGNLRIFLKWEFPNDEKKSSAKQGWLIAPSYDKIRVVQSVGYDKSGNVVYTDNHYHDWQYVLPATYAEAIVETTKEILQGD